MELARSIVATDQIFPGLRSGDPELTVGWSGGDGDVLRVPDGSADVDLRVALAGDHALEIEVLAPGAGLLLHTALGFGPEPTPLETLPLPAGWNSVQLVLPAARLRHGANRLRLEFERLDERPDAASDATAGEAPGAASTAEVAPILVRALRLVGADARPPWPERPGVVELVEFPAIGPGTGSGTGSGAGAGQAPEGTGAPTVTAMRMPTGSTADLHVGLPVGASLRSELRIERAAGQGRAPVRLRVEALGESGEVLVRDEAELEGDQRRAELVLSEIPGTEALLRWTVAGPGNAVAVWERIELVGTAPAVEPVPRRARTLAAPGSGGRLGPRDVIVVLLDAARRDAIGAYASGAGAAAASAPGASTGEVPTPAIDALADTRIDEVMAAAPWTAPSVASMMTGLYPDAHGLQSWDSGVPKSVRSLGESFAAAGYRTVLFSQHPIWGAIPTLRRGFAVQEFVPETERSRLPATELLFGDGPGPDSPEEAVLPEPGAPTFALVHLLLPHDPYDPPPPYRGRYTGESPGDPGRYPVDSGALHDFRLGRGRRAPMPEPDRIAYARARYDETVAWTDAVVGELTASIDAAGRDPEPLVILLSDHGEAFYEHGWFLHTRNLYEEMAAVPWLVRWPDDLGQAGDPVDDPDGEPDGEPDGAAPVLRAGPVSTVDLAPTLIDLLALPYEGLGMHGRSLAPWLFGEPLVGSGPGPGPAYAATTRVETGTAPPLLAWREGRYKVLWDTLWGRLELYDLEADPLEREDLSVARPLLAQRLLQGLLSQRRANERILGAWLDAGQSTELDAESIRRLRALGYLR